MLDLGDFHTSLIDGVYKILGKVDDVYKMLDNDNGVSFHLFNKTTLGPVSKNKVHEYFSSLPDLREEDMLDLGDFHTSLIDGVYKILGKVNDVYKMLDNDNGVSFHLFNKTTLGPIKHAGV